MPASNYSASSSGTASISWEYLMPKRRERAGRYIRESDERLVAGTTTMESQTKVVNEHCESQRYICEPEHEWREAISAVEVPYMERKALLEMLAAAKRHEFDVLVVSEIRALARKQVEVLVIYDILQKYGIRLETVKEKFGEDAMSKAILSLRAMFVEIEVEQSKARMMRGRLDRILIGNAPNPHPYVAYGYCLVDTEKEVKGEYVFNNTVVWVDTLGNEWSPYKVILLIFKLFQSGENIMSICRTLNELHIPTPQKPIKRKAEEAYWQVGAVYGMLKNPIYCGEVWANKTKKVKGANGKKVAVDRPREEWIRLPDAPAIVTKEEFEAIQVQLRINKEESLRNNKQKTFDVGLLRAGYVFCGICGKRMHFSPPGKQNGGLGMYRCDKAREDVLGKARHRTQMRIAVVDAQVHALIVEVLKDPLWIRTHVKQVREKQQTDEPVLTKEEIEKTIEESKQSLRRLYKLAEHATDDDTLEALSQRMNELEKQKRAAERCLFDVSDDEEKEQELEEEIQRFESWAEQVRPTLTDPDYKPTYDELRLAIRILGIRCTIYPTQGEYPFRCNMDITVPEVMKKLD